MLWARHLSAISLGTSVSSAHQSRNEERAPAGAGLTWLYALRAAPGHRPPGTKPGREELADGMGSSPPGSAAWSRKERRGGAPRGERPSSKDARAGIGP